MALHDVGKIAIPDRILLKNEKLDPDEYEIMKTHTQRGNDIVHELADVYDALICPRVYKPAMPYEEAIRIISEGRGTQFDPILTDAVVQIQERFKEISHRNR